MKRKLYTSVLTLALIGQLASPVFATDRILMTAADPDLVIDTSEKTPMTPLDPDLVIDTSEKTPMTPLDPDLLIDTTEKTPMTPLDPDLLIDTTEKTPMTPLDPDLLIDTSEKTPMTPLDPDLLIDTSEKTPMTPLDPDLLIDTSEKTPMTPLDPDLLIGTSEDDLNKEFEELFEQIPDEEQDDTLGEDDFLDDSLLPETNPNLNYWTEEVVAVTLVDNVYTITTPQELAWVASVSSSTFSGKTIKLACDINLEGKEWSPIGSYFSGTFDGGGYTIQNMTITDSENSSYFGLFSSLSSSGTIQNLNITGEISVTIESYGHSFVGGIAGQSYGVVENCHSDVNITHIQTNQNLSGYCSVISGGIVGENGSGTIRNCSNRGSISSSGGKHAEAGGIVGVNGGSSKVYNCRNLGTISASLGQTLSHAGGIAGRNGVEDGIGSSSALVENCYNLATDISGDPQGGVVGYCGNDVNVTHSYTINGLETVGTNETELGYSDTFDDLGKLESGIALGEEYYTTLLSALNGWVSVKDDDLYRYWQEGTDGMPMLGEEGWEPDPAPDTENPDPDTEEPNPETENPDPDTENPDPDTENPDPDTEQPKPETDEPEIEFDTVISDASSLEDFRLQVLSGETFAGKTVGLVEDIVLSSQGWLPIGTLEAPFQGTFEGGGYTISSLSLDNDLSYQGFFGVVEDATIQNLTVSGTVTGGDYVGGLVGLALNSQIVSCKNLGTITGGYAVGGLVGQLRTTEGEASSVTYSMNTGAVSSEGAHPVVGGVIGWSYTSGGTSLVSKSYNTGAIEATGNNVGGIVGYHSVSHDGSANVEHCYNTGSILGNDNVGGILGDSYDMGGTISLATCYNTGLIRGITHVGGIVGFQYQTTGTATVTQAVSLGNIQGESNAHRVVGSSTEAISGNYASSSVTVDGVTVTGGSDSLHGADTLHIDMTLWETAGFTQNNGWEFTTSDGIPTLIAFTPFS